MVSSVALIILSLKAISASSSTRRLGCTFGRFLFCRHSYIGKSCDSIMTRTRTHWRHLHQPVHRHYQVPWYRYVRQIGASEWTMLLLIIFCGISNFMFICAENQLITGYHSTLNFLYIKKFMHNKEEDDSLFIDFNGKKITLNETARVIRKTIARRKVWCAHSKAVVVDVVSNKFVACNVHRYSFSRIVCVGVAHAKENLSMLAIRLGDKRPKVDFGNITVLTRKFSREHLGFARLFHSWVCRWFCCGEKKVALGRICGICGSHLKDRFEPCIVRIQMPGISGINIGKLFAKFVYPQIQQSGKKIVIGEVPMRNVSIKDICCNHFWWLRRIDQFLFPCICSDMRGFFHDGKFDIHICDMIF